MKTLALFGVTLALALPVVAARPAAAAQPEIVAWATGDNDPFVLTWDDPGDGSTEVKSNPAVHSIFANLEYVFTGDGQLTLGKVSGVSLQRIMAPLHAIDVTDGKGYYVVHFRPTGIGMSLDGAIYRYSDQPDQGLARLTWILVDKAGNASTTYIEQNLTFTDTDSSPSPQPKTGSGN
jgi:hypothetical protein